MKKFLYILVLLLAACGDKTNKQDLDSPQPEKDKISLYVLGTVQDGGSPHIGCQKSCCKDLFTNPDQERKVVSLGVVDHENGKSYLFEATPDISSQLKLLKKNSGNDKETPDGIFMTHAHIGHYSGLMYLGREALGAKGVPVYAMPKMNSFMESNGPWNQLIGLGNIAPHQIQDGQRILLTKNLSVTPFVVPHRDEYSETVGFKIEGPNKSVLFIPDIDKWHKWEKDIVREVQKVDFAFLDATFFDGGEINTRNIAEIPHPFVVESMELFGQLSDSEKAKIHFIHLNHTNALLLSNSHQQKSVREKGFKVARFNQQFQL